MPPLDYPVFAYESTAHSRCSVRLTSSSMRGVVFSPGKRAMPWLFTSCDSVNSRSSELVYLVTSTRSAMRKPGSATHGTFIRRACRAGSPKLSHTSTPSFSHVGAPMSTTLLHQAAPQRKGICRTGPKRVYIAIQSRHGFSETLEISPLSVLTRRAWLVRSVMGTSGKLACSGLTTPADIEPRR